MSEPKRSYTMPYAVDRRKSFFLLAALIVLIPLFLFVHNLRAIDNGFSAEARRNLTILYSALFFPAILLYGVRCFARLHFVPEGIAITLCGLTLRRFPAERIRFLSAVHSNSTKIDVTDLIAVCDHSLEELTELHRKRTPKMFQNSHEIWPGEWAGYYLFRRSRSLVAAFNLHRLILWLEWAPERLETLTALYPHAQWLDCTQKKIFDEQLRQR